MKKTSIFAIFVFLFAASTISTAQKKDSQTKGKVKIQLVARYYDNGFFDMSSDGKHLLLFGPSTPNRKKSDGVIEWRPGKERFLTQLRVVEWETGREVGFVPESVRNTTQRPHNALFIEGTSQICINDREDMRLWVYVSGRMDKCSVFPKPYHHIPESFYEERVSENIGKYDAKDSIEKGANFLVIKYRRGVLTLYDRATGEKIGEATHPWEKWWAEYPTAGVIYGIALMRDNNYLLTFYGGDTFIWRIDA